MSQHLIAGDKQATRVHPPPGAGLQQSLNTWVRRFSFVAVFWFVLGVATVQALLYTVVVPPWQHYDEPTHFEYVRLIADRGVLPRPGDEDGPLRREILSTMFATDFFRRVTSPALLADDTQIWLGVTELGHPPLYYALASLPIYLVRHLDILTQLYVARLVSALLFVGVVAITFGIMRELVPQGHTLRWAVPLAVALIPGFADVMTSVNSDAGAAFIGSLFLWGAVRLIKRGLHVLDVVLATAAAMLAVVTKNTASICVLLLVVAVALACWLRASWLRWQWVIGGGAVVILLVPFIFLTSGDASAWYRGSSGSAQDAGTQASVATSVVGSSVLLVEASPDTPQRELINPLLPAAIKASAGKTLTIGAWIWANEPVHQPVLGVRYTTWNNSSPVNVTQPVTVTTTPAFVSWSFELPANVLNASYIIAAQLPAHGKSVQVYVDGALLVPGSFAPTSPPVFTEPSGEQGSWNGMSFTNLIRNGSGERSWLRLKPWFEHAVYHYIHRSPAQVVAALLDMSRIAPQLTSNVLPVMFDSFFGWFGWGSVRLQDALWVLISRVLGVLFFGAACVWMLRQSRGHERHLYFALVLLGLAFVDAWTNTLLRPLPLLGVGDAAPMARYTFPAIVPSVLVFVGGMWVLVPRAYRALALGVFLVGLATLNVVALVVIRNTFL